MMHSTNALLAELIDGLERLGMDADANEIRALGVQLDAADVDLKHRAATLIAERCHVKWYGDLSLPISRPGDYPVLVFLNELKTSVCFEAVKE